MSSVEQKVVEEKSAVPFKYKINYVAAWLSSASVALLMAAGVKKLPHLTTFFDGYGQLSSLVPYEWSGTKTATIASVVEWPVGDKLYLIAKMDCDWSTKINEHYLKQGVREDLPHVAHITLAKNVQAGASQDYQHLVGMELIFDRHGEEVESSLKGMGSAPKDGTPILAWCSHSSDPTTLDGGATLTDYAAACEWLSHVNDGFHVVAWVPESQEGDWESGYYTVPGYWALGGIAEDCCANPVCWQPLPDVPKGWGA